MGKETFPVEQGSYGKAELMQQFEAAIGQEPRDYKSIATLASQLDQIISNERQEATQTTIEQLKSGLSSVFDVIATNLADRPEVVSATDELRVALATKENFQGYSVNSAATRLYKILTGFTISDLGRAYSPTSGAVMRLEKLLNVIKSVEKNPDFDWVSIL